MPRRIVLSKNEKKSFIFDQSGDGIFSSIIGSILPKVIETGKVILPKVIETGKEVLPKVAEKSALAAGKKIGEKAGEIVANRLDESFNTKKSNVGDKLVKELQKRNSKNKKTDKVSTIINKTFDELFD